MKRKWDKWLKWKIGAVASLGVALLFHEVKASPQFAEAAAKSGADSGGDKLAAATASGTDPFAEMQRQNGSGGSLNSGTSGDEGRRGKHGQGRRRFTAGQGAESGSGSGLGGDLGSDSGGTFSRPSAPSDSGSGSFGAPTSPGTRTQTRTTRS